MKTEQDPSSITRASRIVSFLPLAHHRADQLDHCLLLPLGSRRVALCARCLGLYPSLIIVLFLQAFLQSPRPGIMERWLLVAGIFPALLDWGRSWLDHRRGNNAIRVITGALLGISLGRSCWIYLHDPLYEILWIQIGLLTLGAIIFEFLRILRLSR